MLFQRTLLQSKNVMLRQQPLRTSVRFIRTFKQEEQPRLRINSLAPNFTAETTVGKVNFHEYIGNSWAVLFSHPADFTPVCTTELGAFAKLKPEFDKRNVKLIGLSAEGVESHQKWIKDIEEISELDKFTFPIIGDVDREVAFLYDMVDEEGFKNLNNGIVATIRSVYIIDPSKKIRLIITYPASVGRNSSEVLRVIDALQKGDSKGVVTPIDWQPGQDVIIPPTVSDADASKKFGDFTTVKPYLRFTKA
ncbi:mitochondrial peroxiredoxin PRX1 [Kluyveromyces marxianus]|uniref:Mitochondrial peroxiredoxin PRX1 n=2 Tax=Kluyveromyces marxianus TaxID=4911 RepID=W0TKG9_KLUMD|nr:mitochondrial peroxiredoxin PRX1 [Kluyveromyces marxianus DMKU3-1042]QGN17931.1 mitochondrial peroxiredoxin PRX1 [Kluyveromyces marxianus]BAO42669.1 mitochondrial peroxiredoxin PRX1 [Kluyveromyces marxianus DMKU3-1042]BAP74043.1 mitochondrial peroxiredoxin PRX1 [Kluyveromyces marxianus]